MLVQHSSIADPDTGASYTVKKYTSKIKHAEEGIWEHEEINGPSGTPLKRLNAR